MRSPSISLRRFSDSSVSDSSCAARSARAACLRWFAALPLGAVALAAFASCGAEGHGQSASNFNYYGPVPAAEYLMGRFEASQHPGFILLESYGVPTQGRTIYLRREAAEQLKLLYTDFRKAHPDAEFWVTSGLRNFQAQKGIWEAKWTGQRGRNYDQIADPRKRSLAILEYSSMPGTSRHHWGTDFDFNVLTNNYYKMGEGRPLYVWLEENAARYGFCQPYTEGREAGYNEERWHWSYKPLASRYLTDWNRLIGDAFPAGASFRGSEHAVDLASTYVNSINPQCK